MDIYNKGEEMIPTINIENEEVSENGIVLESEYERMMMEFNERDEDEDDREEAGKEVRLLIIQYFLLYYNQRPPALNLLQKSFKDFGPSRISALSVPYLFPIDDNNYFIYTDGSV
ncbi:12812_t:CDS:2 [Rhizophagus irregularis]|nr:12812_t:CDS:2 [Rhizophagus irregularis]